MLFNYSVFNTKAIILHTKAINDADRTITFLLEDGRLIDVFAKSVRKNDAKLRTHCLPYSKVEISIILGNKYILKNIKRIDTLSEVWKSETKYKNYVRLLNKLKYFIPITEITNKHFYIIINEFLENIKKDMDKDSIDLLTLITEIELLKALGYIEKDYFKDSTLDKILENAKKDDKVKRKLQFKLENTLKQI